MKMIYLWYEINNNGMCMRSKENYTSLLKLMKKIIQLIKSDVDITIKPANHCKSINEVEKENTKLEAIVRNTKAVDESFALQTIRLTKAKDILKYVLNSFVGDLPRTLGYFDEEELKAIADAEQFLKENE